MRDKISLNFLKNDWLVGLLVSLVVFALGNGSLLQSLERKAYDMGARMAERTPSDRIAVIAIDKQSLDEIGRWPWSRNVFAEMIEKLTIAKAKVIATTVPFPEPQHDLGLDYINELIVLNNARLAAEASAATEHAATAIAAAAQATAKKQGAMIVGAGRTALRVPATPVDPRPVEMPAPAPDPIASLLVEAEKKLNTDRRLATAIGQAGNVALPMLFQLGQPLGQPGHLLPEFVTRNAVKLIREGEFSPLSAVGVDAGVADVLGTQAAAIGHLNVLPDVDGVIRSESLVLDYFGQAIPSLSLLVAARSLDLRPDEIRVRTGEAVRLGKLKIATAARMLMFFYGGSGSKAAFPVDSFQEVRSGTISPEKYRDKIVLIGPTVAGVGNQFATPVGAAMPAVLVLAHAVSSLLSEHYFVAPAWGIWVERGLFLSIALYLVLLLPRLATALGAAVTVLLLMLLVGTHFFLMVSQLVWLKLMLPTTLLFIGHLLLATKRLIVGGLGKEVLEVAPVESNPGVLAGKMVETVALDDDGGRVYEDTIILDRGEMDKPMLGRYLIEKELGKGAMGVVYQGRDPKTNRIVAIKTMALAQEFDEDELADVKARFFREAETARRLNHPNIVTMFDAGEERDLAYLAMEYLQGHDLVSQTKPDSLLPLPTVLGIIARVADALDYAHSNHVVHRDVKPANIMYEPASDQVKVTDFGIARITDSSRTKTGMVLGTPSYMSPEQLAGKKIDGRSDLFSLGVTLYQLCSGQLPFVGESMAQLMFKIASEPHADIRNAVLEIPACLVTVIDKAMMKIPEQRYQTGGEMARDLRDCLDILQGGA